MVRTLIIHNTASGLHSDDIYSFQRALIQPGDEVVMRATRPDCSAEVLLDDVHEFDAVVASGGDGTFADVAYSMRGSGVPMLVFPSGTANLLANNIGNAADPAGLAETLRNGTCIDLDICEFEYTNDQGELCRRGFLNMAGAGYDANIMQGSHALKSLFGQFSYYMAALGNLNPGTAHFTLTIDGETVEDDGICVLVANWGAVSNWGAVNQAVEFIPDSSPLDGMLDIAVLAVKNSMGLIPAALGSFFTPGKKNAYPNIDFYHAREVHVECDPAFPMQYDGEVIEDATTPFTVRVIPGGLRTLVDSFSPLAHLKSGSLEA